VHAIARLQAAGREAFTAAMPGEERARAADLAERLSVPLMARVWQMLLKGIEEAGRAPNPVAAAEMVLIRIAHTGDLPTPEEIIKAIGGLGGTATPALAAPRGSGSDAEVPQGRATGRAVSTAGATTGPTHGPRTETGGRAAHAVAEPSALAIEAQEAVSQPAAAIALQSFNDVLELASRQRDIQLRVHLEEHVSLVSFQPGRIEVFPLDGASKGLTGELGRKLSEWTGERWVVSVGREMGEPPIGEMIRAERARRIQEAARDPAVAPLLAAFPDAKIIDVRAAADTPGGEAETDE